ncbi:hypothetical protein Zmor_017042 [Zophobas morio]|uniref:Uncharacterized protein n=1 Tax=Zophobas morio TaxID=2755281 RepID=A0AA38I8Y0_9CUCU|nr:hypothetical protein Zmor_017042 [Zophobas morio]
MATKVVRKSRFFVLTSCLEECRLPPDEFCDISDELRPPSRKCRKYCENFAIARPHQAPAKALLKMTDLLRRLRRRSVARLCPARGSAHLPSLSAVSGLGSDGVLLQLNHICLRRLQIASGAATAR